jgi:hypothetical protein
MREVINKILGKDSELERLLRLEANDISFEKWQKVEKAIEQGITSDFDVIGILTGIDAMRLRSLPAVAFTPLQTHIARLMSEIKNYSPPPVTRVVLCGKGYAIPEVGRIEAQRFEDLRAIATDSGGFFAVSDYPMVLAIVLTKSYTRESIDAFAEQLKKEAFTTVFWTAFFLQSDFMRLLKGTSIRFRILHYLMKWLRQVTKT